MGSAMGMKLLVVAPEPVDASAIRSALPGEDVANAEVLVVSPALNESGVAFWMSDSDEAIAEAQRAADATASSLKSEGASVRSTTGESEPLQAIRDALATFPADRVVIFRGGADSYRDEELSEAEGTLGVPVTTV